MKPVVRDLKQLRLQLRVGSCGERMSVNFGGKGSTRRESYENDGCKDRFSHRDASTLNVPSQARSFVPRRIGKRDKL
jgi:hypothetical protein